MADQQVAHEIRPLFEIITDLPGGNPFSVMTLSRHLHSLPAIIPADRLMAGAGVILWQADIQRRMLMYIGPQAERLFGYPLIRWSESRFWDSFGATQSVWWRSFLHSRILPSRQSTGRPPRRPSMISIHHRGACQLAGLLQRRASPCVAHPWPSSRPSPRLRRPAYLPLVPWTWVGQISVRELPRYRDERNRVEWGVCRLRISERGLYINYSSGITQFAASRDLHNRHRIFFAQ